MHEPEEEDPMGMEQTVSFPGAVPSWPTIRDVLTRQGQAVQMRLIDGELSFPDEEPPEAWREIRVAIGGNMVTVRRSAAAVTLVIWGNADAELLRVRDVLAAAFAEAGGGEVKAG
jgi:hypothetical protein